MRKPPFFYIIVLIAFLANTFGPFPQVYAQEFHLPVPGVMVAISPDFNPAILKGIKVHPDNPFQFEFILDQGDSLSKSRTSQNALIGESTKLIKYFLASLTIPDKDLWVNLSPYEKNRIIPRSFGKTEMGRDLLAEDYMLKQITASLIYPEGETGRKFWKKIYEEASKKYGTTNIPVNTFNKVWIVPEKAVVYENVKAGTAYVVDAKLKVMLEQDYLAMSKDGPTQVQPLRNDVNAIGSQVVREIVIPELTREVNENKNFAQLRQVYNSLILAAWYKKKIKDSILAQVYEDKNKTVGVQYDKSVIMQKNAKLPQDDIERIYQRYLQAFKKGVFNYIKEEPDPTTQEIIPRKYFSGGVNFMMNGNNTTMKGVDAAMKVIHSLAALRDALTFQNFNKLFLVNGGIKIPEIPLVFSPIDVPPGYSLIGGEEDPRLARRLQSTAGLTAAVLGPKVYSPFQDRGLALKFMDIISDHIKKLDPRTLANNELRVLVIGSGSGLDALTAFHQAKQRGFKVKIVAVDIKKEAIGNIEENFKLSKDERYPQDSVDVFQVPEDGKLEEVKGKYDLILFNAPDAVSKDQLLQVSEDIRMDQDIFKRILQVIADRLLAKNGMAIIGNQKAIKDPLVTVVGKLRHNHDSLIPNNLDWNINGTSDSGIYLGGQQDDRVFFEMTLKDQAMGAFLNLSAQGVKEEFFGKDEEIKSKLLHATQEVHVPLSVTPGTRGFSIRSAVYSLNTEYYESLRRGNYTLEETYPDAGRESFWQEFQKAIFTDSEPIVNYPNKIGYVTRSASQIFIKNNNRWPDIVQRGSLNIPITRKTIKALDDLLAQGIFKGQYKFFGPKDYNRHDTVSLYFFEEPSEMLKQKLAEIAKENPRGAGLLGRLYSEKIPGFTLSEIGNIQDGHVRDLYHSLLIVAPEIAKGFEINMMGRKYVEGIEPEKRIKEFSERRNRFGMSEGLFYAFRKVLAIFGIEANYSHQQGFSLSKNGVDLKTLINSIPQKSDRVYHFDGIHGLEPGMPLEISLQDGQQKSVVIEENERSIFTYTLTLSKDGYGIVSLEAAREGEAPSMVYIAEGYPEQYYISPAINLEISVTPHGVSIVNKAAKKVTAMAHNNLYELNKGVSKKFNLTLDGQTVNIKVTKTADGVLNLEQDGVSQEADPLEGFFSLTIGSGDVQVEPTKEGFSILSLGRAKSLVAEEIDQAMTTGQIRQIRQTLSVLQDMARPIQSRISLFKVEGLLDQMEEWLKNNRGKTDEVLMGHPDQLDSAIGILNEVNKRFNRISVIARDEAVKNIRNGSKLFIFDKNGGLVPHQSVVVDGREINNILFYDIEDKARKPLLFSMNMPYFLDGLKQHEMTGMKSSQVEIMESAFIQFRGYVQMIKDILNPDEVDVNISRQGNEDKGRVQYMYDVFLKPYAEFKARQKAQALEQSKLEQAMTEISDSKITFKGVRDISPREVPGDILGHEILNEELSPSQKETFESIIAPREPAHSTLALVIKLLIENATGAVSDKKVNFRLASLVSKSGKPVWRIDILQKQISAADWYSIETNARMAQNSWTPLLGYETRHRRGASHHLGSGFLELAKLALGNRPVRLQFEKDALGGMRTTFWVEAGPARVKSSKTGGIDFTANRVPLQIKNEMLSSPSAGIRFHLDPAMLAQLRNSPGFVPVVNSVKPLTNLQKFLGIDVLDSR